MVKGRHFGTYPSIAPRLPLEGFGRRLATSTRPGAERDTQADARGTTEPNGTPCPIPISESCGFERGGFH